MFSIRSCFLCSYSFSFWILSYFFKSSKVIFGKGVSRETVARGWLCTGDDRWQISGHPLNTSQKFCRAPVLHCNLLRPQLKWLGRMNNEHVLMVSSGLAGSEEFYTEMERPQLSRYSSLGWTGWTGLDGFCRAGSGEFCTEMERPQLSRYSSLG